MHCVMLSFPVMFYICSVPIQNRDLQHPSLEHCDGQFSISKLFQGDTALKLSLHVRNFLKERNLTSMERNLGNLIPKQYTTAKQNISNTVLFSSCLLLQQSHNASTLVFHKI